MEDVEELSDASDNESSQPDVDDMCNPENEPVRTVEDVPLKPITEDESLLTEDDFGQKNYPNQLIPLGKESKSFDTNT